MVSLAAEPGDRLGGSIHSTGIIELYVPVAPIADICFVHGFTGHPERTWKSKKPTKRQAPDSSHENPTKRRFGGSILQKLRTGGDRSGKIVGTGSTGSEFVFWPRDLVPDIIPEARVLTFGYDTNIRHTALGPPSKNRLIDHARDFLAALEDCRLSDPARPLIFIAHSLGGLLVKDVLRISKEYGVHQPERALVYSSTTKLVFFGTPHAGADPLGTVHQVLANLVKALGWKVNEAIVQLLMPDAERLEMLRDSFQVMVHERNWVIYTFQEELPLQGLSSKVVEDSSSCINELSHERVVHIHADHVAMCRFGSIDDPEFRKVGPSLERIRQDLLSTTRVDSQAPSCDPTLDVPIKRNGAPMTTIDRERCLERLSFENIDVRYLTLKTAQRKTCDWLPRCHLYKGWKDPSQRENHHGFFWIKGKPGTGKSVTMKYLLLHTKKSKESDVLISFFFNARGSILERTTEGLYRSLLFQLIQGLSDIHIDLDSLVPLQNLTDDKPWPLEALKEAFGSIVEQLGPKRLVCFIDALDECPEDQIRDMIEFFEDIGEKAIDSDSNVRVCFSSRHYPNISIRKGLSIVLENESDHSHDIQLYIESKLRIDKHRRKQEIAEEIFRRSCNIFLWAVLVVDILNKEYDTGRGVDARKRLQQIPTGLHELFHDILTRDTKDLKELVVCLQWILFANRPLRPEELYFAMRLKQHDSGVNGLLGGASYWDQDEIPRNDIALFNLHVSKGLTETTKKQQTIQFIHESVRDYLLQENGLRTLIQDQLGPGVSMIGYSHEVLKHNCLLQLQESLHGHLSIPDPLPKASSDPAKALRSQAEKKFPFLEYAVHNVLNHANSAQGGGSDQEAFMRVFPRELWIKLDNILQKHEIRRHTDQTQLLYLLAEQNLGKLIERHPDRQQGCFLQNKGARYPYPLAAAMALSHYEAIESLAIEAAGGREHASRVVEEISRWQKTEPDRHNPLFKSKTILVHLCLLGSVTFFDLYRNRVTTGDVQQIGYAVVTVPLPILRFLIQHDAKLNILDRKRKTALSYAIEANDMERARDLLKAGADPDMGSPLDHSKSPTATRLLLQHGVRISRWARGLLVEKTPSGEAYDPISVLLEHPTDGNGSSLYTNNTAGHWLYQAAGAAHHPRSLELVQRIVKYNPSLLNFTDDYGDSLLHTAVNHGHGDVIKFLCATGEVEVNATNDMMETPLHRATLCPEISDASQAVQTLLDYNALPNATDKWGKTPLIHAISRSNMMAVDLLLQDPRINIMASDNYGQTAVCFAAKEDAHSSILEKLLEKLRERNVVVGTSGTGNSIYI